LNSPDNYLPDWLTRCAQNRPKHPAVQFDHLQWSFSELDRQVTKLARYKQPRAIYFTKQLPHTSSGKLVRRELPDLPHILHE
jgi:acyl-coenzyme A synthetase/AMP-(fatty) acid ligase